MDYIKELMESYPVEFANWCFNPCCDGLYKRTIPFTAFINIGISVSILVVMDYIKEHGYLSSKFGKEEFQSLL